MRRWYEADNEPNANQRIPLSHSAHVLPFDHAHSVSSLSLSRQSDTFANINAEGERRWLLDRGMLILEFKDKKEPLPPPFNILWMLAVSLPRAVLRLVRSLTSSETEEAPSTGFKLIPDSLKLMKRYRDQELDALRECVRTRDGVSAESIEAKVQVVQDVLSKVQEDTRTHYEAISGRLDRLGATPLR